MRRNQAQCIPFGIIALAAMLPATAASAETPVYADINGMCDGLTPCFATIQAAVNNVTDPDAEGPLFAEVYVFPGTYKESVNLSTMGGGAQGDLQMMTVDAAGMPAPGTVFIDPPAGSSIQSSADPEEDEAVFAGALTLDGFSATSPDVDAIIVYVRGDFVGRNLSANFAADEDDRTDETGLQVESQAGNIIVEHCSATGNDGDGFALDTQSGDVLVNHCTATGNKDGIDVQSDGHAVVTNCVATGGKAPGAEDGEDSADGFQLFAELSLTVENVVAFDNRDDGITLECEGDVKVFNATAERNADNGILAILNGALHLERVTSRGNGVLSEVADGIEVRRLSGDGGVTGVTILNSFVEGNRDHGVELTDLIVGGKHRIHGSIICNNSNTGLAVLETDAAVDARGNWWGDVTGPMHAKNATGLGDAVIDARNGGTGTANFDPWIDQITASASHATATPANEVTVQFQFRHSGSDTFLGEGPGAPNGDRPFTVVTDNGTVESSDGKAAAVSAFVSGDGGIVEVTAKSAAGGQAKVELTGPCFPARSVTFDAVPLPIPLPPTPAPAPPEPLPLPLPAPEQGSPSCGAGVPALTGLSAIGLFASRLATGTRRRSRRM